MVSVKVKRTVSINSETEKNVKYWIEQMGADANDINFKQLRGYLNRMVSTSYEKGFKAGQLAGPDKEVSDD